MHGESRHEEIEEVFVNEKRFELLEELGVDCEFGGLQFCDALQLIEDPKLGLGFDLSFLDAFLGLEFVTVDELLEASLVLVDLDFEALQLALLGGDFIFVELNLLLLLVNLHLHQENFPLLPEELLDVLLLLDSIFHHVVGCIHDIELVCLSLQKGLALSLVEALEGNDFLVFVQLILPLPHLHRLVFL